MKSVDAMEFKNRKEMGECEDWSSENYEMEIISEGALDKVLMIPERIRQILNNLGRQYMRLLTMNNFNNQVLFSLLK